MRMFTRRRLIIGAVIAILLGAWIVVANVYDSTSTALVSLKSGDCFEFPSDNPDSIERVETPACTEPHDGQIYYRFKPDRDMTDDQKIAMCDDEGGTNILNDQLPEDSQTSFFEIGFGSIPTRTLCYIEHRQNVAVSHVVADPQE